MDLKFLELAEYAAVSNQGKLIIAGIFDSGEVRRLPGAPPDAPFAFPPFFLVFVVSASLAEGTDHMLTLRMENEDQQPLAPPAPIHVHFKLNPNGRLMRFQGIVQLNGLALPRPGDYLFRLFQDKRLLGEANLYIDLRDGDQ